MRLWKPSKKPPKASARGAEAGRSRLDGAEAERQGLLARIAELEDELAALSSASAGAWCWRLDGAIRRKSAPRYRDEDGLLIKE